MLLLRSELTEPAQKTILDSTAKIIDKAQGEVHEVLPWGRRKLAYEINHISEALYFLISFSAPTSALEELNHALRINDQVIRFMPVRAEKLPPPKEVPVA